MHVEARGWGCSLSRNLVILGGGGHAKVVIENLESEGYYSICGYTVTNGEAGRQPLLGYPFLGGDDILPRLLDSGVRWAFVAIGDNAARMRCLERVRVLGFSIANAVSSRACVSKRATLGAGVAIMPGAVVNVETRIGDGVIVNTNAGIDHDCEIGDHCHIAPGAAIAGSVKIDTGAFLGIGCRVLPGVRVGSWSVVGGGAVVTSNLPPDSVAIGVPARVTRRIQHE